MDFDTKISEEISAFIRAYYSFPKLVSSLFSTNGRRCRRFASINRAVLKTAFNCKADSGVPIERRSQSAALVRINYHLLGNNHAYHAGPMQKLPWQQLPVA